MIFAKKTYFPDPDYSNYFELIGELTDKTLIMQASNQPGNIGDVHPDLTMIMFRPRVSVYLNNYFKRKFTATECLKVESLEASDMYFEPDLGTYITDISDETRLCYCLALSVNLKHAKKTMWPLDNMQDAPVNGDLTNVLELVSQRNPVNTKAASARAKIKFSLFDVTPVRVERPPQKPKVAKDPPKPMIPPEPPPEEEPVPKGSRPTRSKKGKK